MSDINSPRRKAYELRPVTTADLAAIAAVHLSAFPASLLSRLGHETVCRYYDWQLTGPHEVVALGAFCDDRLAGFSFGGRFKGSLTGFLQKNRAFLAWRLATHFWLLGLPEVRDRFATAYRLLFRRPQRGLSHLPAYTQPSFGILAIAVSPTVQGRGIGRALMEASELAAAKAGYLHLNLTVATDNQQAIRFYEGLGWRKRLDAAGKWWGAMEKNILE